MTRIMNDTMTRFDTWITAAAAALIPAAAALGILAR